MTDKQRLVSENLGLVHSCASKFKNRGAEYDDLYGAGCLGLVKAANGFDEGLGFAFSTYAVPVILGEIKRIFRDGGAVKVSRSIKEKALILKRESEKIREETGGEPTVGELSKKLGLSYFETAELILSLQPPVSLTEEGDDGEEAQLDVSTGDSEEALSERLDLKDCILALDEADRRLIELRFYKCKTQSETAKALNMTQVGVSRRERLILAEIRRKMAG